MCDYPARLGGCILELNGVINWMVCIKCLNISRKFISKYIIINIGTSYVTINHVYKNYLAYYAAFVNKFVIMPICDMKYIFCHKDKINVLFRLRKKILFENNLMSGLTYRFVCLQFRK